MKKSELEALLRKFSPAIRRAFLASVKDIGQSVDVAALKRAAKAQDVSGALSAMNIDEAAFEPLRASIESSFAAGGTGGAQGMGKIKTPGGGSATVRFDVRDLEAEKQIRNHSSKAVKEITDSTREAIRVALEDAFIKGDNPTTITSKLLGVRNPATGLREGGTLGITGPQQQQAINAAKELDEHPGRFLKRAMRDKRMDRTIAKAIAEKKPLTKEFKAKAVARLKENMAQLRAKSIGRTEAMTTLHMGNRSSYQQAINKGLISAEDIEREWSSTGDNKTRESHRDMDGDKVAWDEAYTTPSGAKLMYPGDPQGPAEEVINCRCWEITRINYLKRFQ